MSIIRSTLLVSKNVNKHRDEYPNLYNDFQIARKEAKKVEGNGFRKGIKNSWVKVSDESYKEYLAMVEKYLAVKNFPNNNRKVVITTHNGGKHVGFYENKKWWYSTLDNPKVEEKGIVVKWEKNCF